MAPFWKQAPWFWSQRASSARVREGLGEDTLCAGLETRPVPGLNSSSRRRVKVPQLPVCIFSSNGSPSQEHQVWSQPALVQAACS